MQKDPQHRFQSAEEMQAAIAPWAQPSSSTAPPPMAVADPTAPTMQAFGGTQPPRYAGSAPPPAKGSALGWVLVIVIAVLLLGGGLAVAYVKLVRPDSIAANAPAASVSASSAPSTAPSSTPVVLPSTTADDGGAKPASPLTKRDGGGLFDARSQIADASAPSGPLKPSAYISSI